MSDPAEQALRAALDAAKAALSRAASEAAARVASVPCGADAARAAFDAERREEAALRPFFLAADAARRALEGYKPPAAPQSVAELMAGIEGACAPRPAAPPRPTAVVAMVAPPAPRGPRPGRECLSRAGEAKAAAQRAAAAAAAAAAAFSAAPPSPVRRAEWVARGCRAPSAVAVYRARA